MTMNYHTDDVSLQALIMSALPHTLATKFIESSTKIRDFNNLVDNGVIRVIACITVNALVYIIPCKDVETIERIMTLYNHKRIHALRFYQINSLSANQAKDILNG